MPPVPLMQTLLRLLRDPSVDHLDVDGAARVEAHGRMFARKRLLREVFTEFHHLFRALDERLLSGEGTRIELGAGVAPMKASYPDVLSTDVVDGPAIDRILDAEDLDLPDASVRVFYGQNCFHHFPHPTRFFEELERTLVPGGGAILLEPYHGPVAGFMYKRLFATEGFDKAFPEWETPAAGPMNGANQALSYIVFTRDRARFEREHPGLELVHEEQCRNGLKYLLSGGLNFRQLCPDALSPLVSAIERLMSPLRRWLALHHVVVIRKRATPGE